MADGGNADSMRATRRSQADEERFWRTASAMLDRDGVTRSTMMGFPCLRVEGMFFASYDRTTGDLIVKLSADRVTHLIATGEGRAFAPAGRRFREWIAIPPGAEAVWPHFLTEAHHFVSQ